MRIIVTLSKKRNYEISIIHISIDFRSWCKRTRNDCCKERKERKSCEKKKGLLFTQVEIVRNDIPYGSDETFAFDFKNESKTPAIIQGVQTSCGCTTAKSLKNQFNMVRNPKSL